MRGWPILGFVGPNGGGKSAAMVWTSIPSLAAGRRVLSTVRLLDFEDPRPCEGWEMLDGVRVDCAVCSTAEGAEYEHRQAHPLYERLHEWGQMIEAKSCDVLLDEVTGVASSRDTASMPSPVANKLVQLRRADVTLRWSAPAWARSDKIIRETSQAVVYCTGYLSKSAPGGDRMWSQRRLFKWRVFDAMAFEDFTAGKREALGPELVDWHWGPGSPAFDAYDTYDSVSVVGTVTDSGRCYQCGGSRPVPKCSCVRPTHSTAGSTRAATAEREAEPEPTAGALVEPGRRRRLDVVALGEG